MEDKLSFCKRKSHVLCMYAECDKKQTCVRSCIVGTQNADIVSLNILNPNHLAQIEGECPYYMSTEPETYAKGFVFMLDSMSPQTCDKVRTALILRYGRKNYYKYRKGDLLLTPEEQDFILNLIKSEAPGVTLQFDEYVEVVFK